jgi:hypothetical protein
VILAILVNFECKLLENKREFKQRISRSDAAFMSSASVLRGLSARAGFFHMEPTWYELNKSQTYFEWFMWMSRLDVEQMTRVPISALQTR